VEEPVTLSCRRRTDGAGLIRAQGSRRRTGSGGLTGSKWSGPVAWMRLGSRTSGLCSHAGAAAR
jgi:hypothetical protein